MMISADGSEALEQHLQQVRIGMSRQCNGPLEGVEKYG